MYDTRTHVNLKDGERRNQSDQSQIHPTPIQVGALGRDKELTDLDMELQEL